MNSPSPSRRGVEFGEPRGREHGLGPSSRHRRDPYLGSAGRLPRDLSTGRRARRPHPWSGVDDSESNRFDTLTQTGLSYGLQSPPRLSTRQRYSSDARSKHTENTIFVCEVSRHLVRRRNQPCPLRVDLSTPALRFSQVVSRPPAMPRGPRPIRAPCALRDSPRRVGTPAGAMRADGSTRDRDA